MSLNTDKLNGLAMSPTGSASDTPRTNSEWNTYEPQCADASQLAELMYQWACELERESERRRKDILRWVHRYEELRRKMPNKGFN